MADKPVTEVVQVDAVLDALSSPSSSDVYEALGPYSDGAVAAVAAKRAAAGGGGGSQTLAEILAASGDADHNNITNIHNITGDGGDIDTGGGGLTTGGGSIDTGTGSIYASGADVAAYSVTIDSGGGGIDATGTDITQAASVKGVAGATMTVGDTGAGSGVELNGRLGFFGTTPITRPTLPINPTADDIRDALVALGLVLQDS